MRARVLLALPLLGAVAAVAFAARPPIALHDTTPERNAVVPPRATIVAELTRPADPASVDATAFSVHEVVGAAVGPPLPGGTVAGANGDRDWTLTLPGPLGSSATYEVVLADVRARRSSARVTLRWRFRTGADATAPTSLTAFSAAQEAGRVVLRWAGPLDFDRAGVVVLRREGLVAPQVGDPEAVVVGDFPSPVDQAVDAGVAAGTTYRYAAYARDRDAPPLAGPAFIAPPVVIPGPPAPPPSPPVAAPAGAAAAPAAPVPSPPAPAIATPASRGAARTPARLLAPTGALRARRAFTLRWRRDPRAAYYNVQLFRGRIKALSRFPIRTRLAVPGRRLLPGRYRLVIWSGLGPKVAARYARRPWVATTVVVRAAARTRVRP